LAAAPRAGDLVKRAAALERSSSILTALEVSWLHGMRDAGCERCAFSADPAWAPAPTEADKLHWFEAVAMQL